MSTFLWLLGVLSTAACARALSAPAAAIAAATSSGAGFRTRRLGSSNLRVTEACLGTMTWGVQNNEAEAHAQLDFAIKERGVNFVDTAELYPVPLTAPEYVLFCIFENVVPRALLVRAEPRHALV
jgi:aryl-alcohol dehydrogenase-like predicted oxidoreductase